MLNKFTLNTFRRELPMPSFEPVKNHGSIFEDGGSAGEDGGSAGSDRRSGLQNDFEHQEIQGVFTYHLKKIE